MIAVLKENRSFRRVAICYALFNLVTWMLIGALPVLAAKQFGVGETVVSSMVLVALARFLLGPIAAWLLRRYRSGPIVAASFLLLSATIGFFPYAQTVPQFLTLSFVSGILSSVIVPSLLILRSQVIVESQQIKMNALLQGTERLMKLIGIAVSGLVITGVGAQIVCVGLSLICILSALAVPRGNGFGKFEIREDAAIRKPTESAGILWDIVKTVPDFFSILRSNRTVFFIFLAAAGYMVSVGAMQPYLFFLNADVFENSPEFWSILIAVQGAGALLGAAICNRVARRFHETTSLLAFYFSACLLEGGLHLCLVFAGTYETALTLLFLSGIPEILSYIVYFTIIQKTLNLDTQKIYFALMVPVVETLYLLGLASGFLITEGILSANIYWGVFSLFGILSATPYFGYKFLKARKLPINPPRSIDKIRHS